MPPAVRPRRVLMTTDTLGGVWAYSLELVRALQGHGVRVVLAAMGGPLTLAQRREAAAVPGLTLRVAPFKLEWMQDPWDDVNAAGRWLLEIEHELDPDLVHLNNYVHGALPWRNPCLVVGHSCVLSWWQAVHGTAAPHGYAAYHAAVAKGLRAADLVAAPSRTMLQALNHHYGPLPRSLVVHNGRDPRAFRSGTKQPLLLTVGRAWDAAKNIGAVAQVAQDLDWPTYVAGDVQHPEGGEAALAQVRRLGPLAPEALARWYAQASIYVLPARYEPFGLSVLEAALSGCALVLGDIPSLRELWDGAAEFVPVDDTDRLLGVLQELSTSPRRRRRLMKLARARAMQYPHDRMVSVYLALYETLLTTQRRGARLETRHAGRVAGLRGRAP
jgi:glycogen synthase